MEPNFILKGNICYCKTPERFTIVEHGVLVCKEGLVEGVYQEVPEEFSDFEVKDAQDRFIIPGLVDLHLHAPQYTLRATHMDLELLEWLENYAFPAEAKYRDAEYARKAYGIFVDRLRESATTRACMFGTLHVEATEILMELLEASGLQTMVGKVNMDRNSPDYLREENAEVSGEATVEWIKDCKKKFKNTRPILTPRFIPSCTDELMENLKKIQLHFQLPLQSHLSENLSEIDWVQELCPNSAFYGDAYDQFGLFGADCPTIMAHCVHSSDEEIQRMKENGVFVAHCPESNMNLASGIAPVRRYLEEGLKVGLGSDIAGGTKEDMFAAMMHAIQCSKLRWRVIDDTLAPLTASEVFYLATKGGGEFFGKVGSFEPGYEFDAVVLDDSRLKDVEPVSVADRIERFIYLEQEEDVKAKYVAGKEIFWR